MGKITVLGGTDFTVGTGTVLAAFQTAAAGTAGSTIAVKRIEVAQSGTATLGMVRGELATRNTAGTLTMTSMTPVGNRPIGGYVSALTGNTAPAGGTARSGINSSADSGGTYTSLQIYFAVANTAGWLWKPDPTEEVIVPPSTLFVVRLLATPTSTTGWMISVTLDEN